MGHVCTEVSRRATEALGLLVFLGFAQKAEVLAAQQLLPLPRLVDSLKRQRVREQPSCIMGREWLETHVSKGVKFEWHRVGC